MRWRRYECNSLHRLLVSVSIQAISNLLLNSATSLVATSVACKRVAAEKNADPLYLSIACLKDDTTSYRGQLFRTDNCSGDVVFELENRLPVCDTKATSYQCLPKQDGYSFGEHKGLFT